MNGGKTLFAQLMDFLPWSTFTVSSSATAATLGCGRSVAPSSSA